MIEEPSADPHDRYVIRQFQASDSTVLPYRLLMPCNYDAKYRYPLVLLLHGAGERGADNVVQLVHGAGEFACVRNMERFPCFVVVPQCPEDDQWVDTPWTAPAHEMPDEPTKSMRCVRELLDALQGELTIDAQRLYITGLSMGGFGVWDAIQRWPDLFAAALPICGGGDTSFASRIARIPIWAVHGALDADVDPQRSRDMITAIRAAGGSPRYTEYVEGEHDSWTETYRNPEVLEWLFAQAITR
jgi:predicted peptidase